MKNQITVEIHEALKGKGNYVVNFSINDYEIRICFDEFICLGNTLIFMIGEKRSGKVEFDLAELFLAEARKVFNLTTGA